MSKCAKKYKGEPFTVTINRGEMERRYVLNTIDSTDWSMTARNDPMASEDFVAHYGFSPQHPHVYVEMTICPCCQKKRPLVEKRRTRTAYVDDDRNFIISCWGCYKENDEYWKERWDEYYRSAF